MISQDQHTEEDNWISIADLMSGMMVIFLFISISYMVDVVREKDRIEDIAETYERIAEEYDRIQNGIYVDLFREFEVDLNKWNATIRQDDLSIIFREPDVLFGANQAEIRDKFKSILDDFFPRYIAILFSEKYRNEISEIRIEGHTSTEWNASASPYMAYINNMKLSQARALSVLSYVYKASVVTNSELEVWLKGNFTANGLSSSHIIIDSHGVEDESASRRVEFRVRTNAENKIKLILGGS